MLLKLCAIFAAGLIIDVLMARYTRAVTEKRPLFAACFNSVITIVRGHPHCHLRRRELAGDLLHGPPAVTWGRPERILLFKSLCIKYLQKIQKF